MSNPRYLYYDYQSAIHHGLDALYPYCIAMKLPYGPSHPHNAHWLWPLEKYCDWLTEQGYKLNRDWVGVRPRVGQNTIRVDFLFKDKAIAALFTTFFG